MFRCRLLLPAFSLLVLVMAADAGQSQTPAKDLHGDALPADAVARLGTIRCRHDTTIVFAGVHPDGKSVLSASSDGVICAWEFPSGKEIRRFEAIPAKERQGESPATLTKASLSPDGKHVTAFCSDGFVRIWDWANAKQLGKVANNGGGDGSGGLGGLGGFAAIAFAGLGQARGAPSFDHAYSPDGKALILSASPRVLQFVGFPNGKDIGPSLGHTHSLTKVAFSADGGQLLSQDTKSTRGWNAATGKETECIHIKLPPGLSEQLMLVLGGGGSAPAISPNGRAGAAISPSFTNGGAGLMMEAVLFDTASGKVLHRLPFEAQANFMFMIPAMTFSPDSKILAIHAEAKQKIELYEFSSGKLLRTLDSGPAAPQVQQGILPGMIAPFKKIVYSADGKALAFQAGPGANIGVRDSTTGAEIAALVPVKGSQATQRAFAPDGRCLALDMGDGTVTLYELASGRLRSTYGTKRPPSPPAKDDPLAGLAGLLGGPLPIDLTKVSVAIAPDGKLLALSGPDGTVQLWDVVTGKELPALKGHTATVTALAFAPHSKTLASASADTTALLWDVTKIQRPALPAKALSMADLEKRWQALVESDASKAWAAVADLTAAPKEAVAWIKEQVKPAAALDMKRLEELMAQLDSNQFKVREKATSDLLKIGDQIVPALDKALAANPPLETKQRLEALRGKLTGLALQGERLRAYRAVEVLELIGTPEARQVLKGFADGAPGALLTTSAQAALKR